MDKLNALIRQLTCGDDERAENAAEEIGQAGATAIPALTQLLEEEDPDARWWAVRALAGIQNAPLVGELLNRALHDPDPAVKQCAALGISLHPDASMIPDLVDCLSGKDQLLARLSGNALVAVGTEAVPPLLDVMENGPQIARLEAVKALAEIGDTRAIPVFFKAIQDGDSQLIEYWSDVGLKKLGIGMSFFSPD